MNRLTLLIVPGDIHNNPRLTLRSRSTKQQREGLGWKIHESILNKLYWALRERTAPLFDLSREKLK